MGLNCLFGSPTVQCKPTMVSLPTSTGRFVRISYLVTGPRKRILTYRGSITVWLTSSFTCLDSTALQMFNNNRFTCLVKSNPNKQLVSCTVILPFSDLGS